MRGAAGTVAVAIVSALALALGLSTSAWAANAFSTHSYGADFASINWGDACDSANNENELVTDFQNDWLTVTFHGAMNRAPWHVSSIDLSNTSSHRISFVQSRWGFRVNDVYAPVYVTVPDLYPGQKVSVPVDYTNPIPKVVAFTTVLYDLEHPCNQVSFLVDHG